jgi:hypothetical protein
MTAFHHCNRRGKLLFVGIIFILYPSFHIAGCSAFPLSHDGLLTSKLGRATRLFDSQHDLTISGDIPSTRTGKRKESSDQKQRQRQQQQQPDVSVPLRRTTQNRRKKASNRKPRNYWKDINNIEKELRDQWKSVLVESSKEDDKNQSTEDIIDRLLPNDQPPPIPNETLLIYWQRLDLSNAIRNVERSYLAESLGGALVVPGKWKLAVTEPIVKRVIELDDNLTEDRPPLLQQQLDELKNVYSMSPNDIEKWKQSRGRTGRYTRRRRGFWSKEKVKERLYV